MKPRLHTVYQSNIYMPAISGALLILGKASQPLQCVLWQCQSKCTFLIKTGLYFWEGKKIVWRALGDVCSDPDRQMVNFPECTRVDFERKSDES